MRTDRAFLRDVQYRDDSRLATRQAIYAYEKPYLDLPAEVYEAINLGGQETIVDVGCGNGIYLARLARGGHRGRVLGIDLSPGMLRAAAGRAPAARLLAADAAALPLRSGVADVTLAMHMLYHVPRPADAVAELRRVTRPGGKLVVALNGDGHLRRLWDLIDAALTDSGRPAVGGFGERLRLDQGEHLLRGVFAMISRQDYVGELVVPDPRLVADYVQSMSLAEDPAVVDQIAADVVRRLQLGADGMFRVGTHAGFLICSDA